MIIHLSEEAFLNLAQPPYDTEGLTCVILGNKGSGKSNIMAVMAEESHANQLPFIYYDPNGDAISLRELGDDIITLGDPGDPEPVRRAHYPLELALREPADFIRMILRDGYSLIVDMREQDAVHPLQVFSVLVEEHFRQAGKLREPCLMFVDEAHAVAPQSGLNDFEKISRRSLGKVVSDGRKRGMVLVAASQHATYLDKRVIRGANLRIFGKCTYLPDYKVIKEYTPATFQQMLRLRSGEVYIISEKAWGVTRINRRRTADLGQTPAFKPRARKARPSLSQLQLPLEAA
jgi:DNA helicase HerA-like ATPase